MRITTTLAFLALVTLPAAAGDREPGPAEPAAAEAPADPAPALEAARKELAIARGEFRRMARFERMALKDAREVTAATRRGRALAPVLGAAADLLGKAAESDAANARLLHDMAKSFRAMAEELDPRLGAEAKAGANALLAEAADERDDERTAASWSLVKRGDPRYRALACNMKALGQGFTALGSSQHEGAAAAAKLHEALTPYFEGVETGRPGPEPEPVCTSGG